VLRAAGDLARFNDRSTWLASSGETCSFAGVWQKTTGRPDWTGTRVVGSLAQGRTYVPDHGLLLGDVDSGTTYGWRDSGGRGCGTA